eukprot:scaffold660_cov365-Pavlova_lutheri.AAC.19
MLCSYGNESVAHSRKKSHSAVRWFHKRGTKNFPRNLLGAFLGGKCSWRRGVVGMQSTNL